jgi:hypothetical protein
MAIQAADNVQKTSEGTHRKQPALRARVSGKNAPAARFQHADYRCIGKVEVASYEQARTYYSHARAAVVWETSEVNGQLSDQKTPHRQTVVAKQHAICIDRRVRRQCRRNVRRLSPPVA